MKNLTVRQKFILNSLLEKGLLNIKGLSQQIDVSKRTILREVSAINQYLNDDNIRISDSSGELLISGDEENLVKVKEQLGGIPHLWLLSQEQRQVIITAQLLLAKEPIKSAYFSYQFNVVEGTIIAYLDKIEEWLKVNNLKLIRKRGYGLEVEGTDWDKRNAFGELLYEYKSINDLLGFLYEDIKDYSLITFFEVTFGEELIQFTKNLLKEIDKSTILKNNDVRNFGAFLHLLLAINRLRNGSCIELPEYLVQEVISSNEFSFIKEVDKILQENGVQLPEKELVYLAIHLNGDKYLYKASKTFTEVGIDLGDIINEIMYLVGKKLNIKINCDTTLMTGLGQHINAAFYRLTMGLEVRNPIIKDIKEYYPDLFEAVDFACKLVFSKYNINIPENEVGYITMHIGAGIEKQNLITKNFSALVICPNGMSTAKILCNKLKSKFPELDKIEVRSLRELNEEHYGEYDIVLSTVKIKRNLYDNMLVVSPFLSEKDVFNINELIKRRIDEKYSLDSIVLSSENNDTGKGQEDFDEANNILQNVQLKSLTAKDFKLTIKEIVSEITEAGIVQDSEKVENLIFKREERGSVVIPKSHVALIHVRGEEISEPFLGAYRIKDFIKMKSAGFSMENVDTFLVMLAKKDESNYILELLGRVSVALVEDEGFTEILRIGDIKDIRNKLIKILNREEY